MIAVDTNILVYAHRGDSRWNEAARRRLEELAGGRAPWAVPWPCVLEFLSTVTHPRVFDPPSTLDEAIDEVESWRGSPTVVLLAETEGTFEILRATLETSRVVGPKVHDARIAALCMHHGVEELWSADRDFGRFPGLRVRNPLVD